MGGARQKRGGFGSRQAARPGNGNDACVWMVYGLHTHSRWPAHFTRLGWSSSEQTVNVRLPHVDGQHEGQVVAIAFPPTICWLDPEKPSEFHSARELAVDSSSYIAIGHRTPTFWRMANKRQGAPAEQLCFSVVTTERTLDFAADSAELAQQWASALTLLVGIAAGHYDMSPRDLTTAVASLSNGPAQHPDHPSLQRLPPTAAAIHGGDMIEHKEDDALSSPRPGSSRFDNRRMEAVQQAMLRHACSGNAQALLECLAMGCAVDIMDPATGDTPLLLACRNGHANIAQICLDYGARNDPHPDFGQTALHAAVSTGEMSQRRRIVIVSTWCHVGAWWTGHLDCAKAILETASPSGADRVVTNLADPRRQTSLHVACELGNVGCIELLLAHGADMSLRRFDSRNPIHICALQGHR